MTRKSIIASHKPFCRYTAFTCKSCKYKAECLQLTHKFTCLRIPKYPIWEKLYAKLADIRMKRRDAYIITNKMLPEEFVWESAYSANNTIQMNVFTIHDSGEWVAPLVHLAERCGICTNLVLHSIIPIVVPPVNIFTILDSIKSCANVRIVLNFANYRMYGNVNKAESIIIHKTPIPIENFKFIWEKHWKVADNYKNYLIDLIAFYKGVDKTKLVICGR